MRHDSQSYHRDPRISLLPATSFKAGDDTSNQSTFDFVMFLMDVHVERTPDSVLEILTLRLLLVLL